MTSKNKSLPSDGVFRYRLLNGAILLVKEDPSAPVVSLNLWIEAGSIDELPDERGMAHLIEHMIFKGTAKRGVGEISRQVEAAGGYLNAFTSYEHTCFYVVLPSSQIQRALEIEFDAYLHSTFDAGELAKEKEVVFEEMRMRRDDPWSWSWELLFKLLFKRNPYHWPVIGDMDILRKVPREKLLAYYHAHYAPSNTVISVVGRVSAEKVLSWARRNFESIRKPKPPQRRFLADAEPQKLQVHTEAGEVQQIYLSLGFPTVPIHHPDSAVLEVLAAVLGDGAASRFNLSLRENSQAADEAASEYFSGRYGGAVVFQGLTDARRLEKCLQEMMAEVEKISASGVPEAELAKVKNKVKASKVFEKQSMDGQAKTLGFWELQGGYEMEEAFLKSLEAVDSADLRRACDKYLRPNRGSLLVYHPKAQTVSKDPGYWEGVLLREKTSPAVGASTRPAPEKIRKLTLKNGSALWVKERKSQPLISIGAFATGGFWKETSGKYGITTLMTKCLQKGTLKKDHARFSHEIESYAAHLDTVLEKDYWGVQLDVLKPNFEKSLDLMLESLYEPAFDGGEVEKEKKLQISAIERLKDDPAEYALLQSDLVSFESTPYAHMPLGTVDTVSRLSARDVREWHRQHISGLLLTWVAVGDFDAAELKKILDAKLPAAQAKRSGKFPFPLRHVLESRLVNLESDSQQANLVVGFKAPSFHSPGYFSFRVLNTLLNGMGGKLFIELREKKSLAYSVFAAHDAGALAGIYQIYLGCAPSKAPEAQRELLKVLDSFAQGKITQQELERAKTYMIGLYQVGFQSNRSQVSSYARYELSGWGAPWVEKFPDLIQRVTLKDVRAAARKYLGASQKTWVVLTPSPTKGE